MKSWLSGDDPGFESSDPFALVARSTGRAPCGTTFTAPTKLITKRLLKNPSGELLGVASAAQKAHEHCVGG